MCGSVEVVDERRCTAGWAGRLGKHRSWWVVREKKRENDDGKEVVYGGDRAGCTVGMDGGPCLLVPSFEVIRMHIQHRHG